MRLRLLGPVELVAASGSIALGGPKQRSVLALLAMSANRVVASERLIAGVWGEEASDRAGATLQVYISNLRRILRAADGDSPATPTIKGQSPGYVLTFAPQDVDVLEFGRLVEVGRGELAAGRIAGGADLLHEALGLWRGGALADLADEPFAAQEIVRLEQGRLGALEERIEADLTLGRHREIVAELEQLVAEHPLRERLWGQLIVSLYRADRQADALSTYGRARSMLAEELGIDPGPALRELERSILAQDLDIGVPIARAVAVVAPVRLPTPIGRTVGRDDEIATLRARLADGDARMLTLTGPGGSGKTRLVIGLAKAAADDFAGGVYFVDLTALTEAAQVMPAITRTLGGAEATTQPVADAVLDALAERDVLLILDNFEHVLGAASEVASLLRSAPRLRVLVSSQTPLRLAEEAEYRVRGLSTPRTGSNLTDIAQADAVRLFVLRAKGIRPDFALTADNAELVAEICRRVDGLPLAIELAVARLRMFSLESIHARLDDSLALLTSGHRDAPVRQRTLRAAVQWSVDLLDDQGRAVLGHLGVFAGEFDHAAALAICGAAGEPGLETLLEISLLRIEDDDGEPRFRMLDAIRQYAREALLPPGEQAADLEKLIQHYVSAAEAARQLIDGPSAFRAAAQVDRQQANFRLALQSSLRLGEIDAAARIAVALAPLWLILGRVGEARHDLAQVIAAGSSPPLAAAVQAAAGRLAYQQNDLEAARTYLASAVLNQPGRAELTRGDAALARCLLAAIATSTGDADAQTLAEEALTLAEEEGDYAARVVARSVLAIAAARRGDFVREKELYEERLALARRRDDRVRVADTLTVLGEIAFDERDYATATALVREAFALSDGYSRPESRDALIMMGRIAVADGDPERAVGFLDEALLRSTEIGQPAALALCLRAHAAVATLLGDGARAARLFGAGDTLQPASMPVNAEVERDLAGRRTECRELLGDSAFEREYRQGAAMDPTQAITLTLRAVVSSVAL